jgi:hypothetical protein
MGRPILKEGLVVTFATWVRDSSMAYNLFKAEFGNGFMGKKYKVTRVAYCDTYEEGCMGSRSRHMGCKGRAALKDVETGIVYPARCFSFPKAKTNKYELILRQEGDVEDLDSLLGL